jgi:hypothetical protein
MWHMQELLIFTRNANYIHTFRLLQIYKGRYYQQPAAESAVETFNYPVKQLGNFMEYVMNYIFQH